MCGVQTHAIPTSALIREVIKIALKENDVIENPLVRTASFMQQWYNTKGMKIKLHEAIKNPSLIEPGTIFVLDRSEGNGYIGIIISIHGNMVHCIEGNTNTLHKQVQGVYETWCEI